MKGTYVTQFNLFVPGKKGLEQPGAHFSAPYLGLSLCLSLSNTQMHTHVHTCTHVHTHALPKDGSGTCLLALLAGGCRGICSGL